MAPTSEPSTGPDAPATAAAPTIDRVALADDPGAWAALGFDVRDGVVALGSVRVALVGKQAGRGILGWSLRDAGAGDLDGLPTTSSRRPRHPPAPAQPNGVMAIDHIVAMSPDLDRSVEALQAVGLELRRLREQPTPAGAPRQAFFRLEEVVFEVVEVPESEIGRFGGRRAATRFWGLALLSGDIDRTALALGEHAGEVRPAVQPGRRIATLKRSAGLAVPVALMSERAGAAQR